MMKKINNKKTISLYTGILTIALVLLLFSEIILFLLKPSTSYLIFLLICGGIFIIVFYTFLKIKRFEYENSMQVITIKQSYLWKVNPTISPIEFPNNMLSDFNIREGLFSTYLMLVVKSNGQKTKKLYCKITGLKDRQIFELKQSLQQATEYAEN